MNNKDVQNRSDDKLTIDGDTIVKAIVFISIGIIAYNYLNRTINKVGNTVQAINHIKSAFNGIKYI